MKRRKGSSSQRRKRSSDSGSGSAASGGGGARGGGGGGASSFFEGEDAWGTGATAAAADDSVSSGGELSSGGFSDADEPPRKRQMVGNEEESSADEYETPAEARLRMARQLLGSMTAGVRQERREQRRRRRRDDGGGDGEVDGDGDGDGGKGVISSSDGDVLSSGGSDSANADVSDDEREVRRALGAKLHEQAALALKKRKRFIARSLTGTAAKENTRLVAELRGHVRPVTTVALSVDGARAYSAGKDCTINVWDVAAGKMLHRVRGLRRTKGNPGNAPVKPARLTKEEEQRFARDCPNRVHGHCGEILALAVSSDGRYLATAGTDRYIKIWDAQTLNFIDSLQGHRGRITALAFRINSTELYSASDDRTVKVWDVQALMYITTLYGHQSAVTSVDAAWKERCLSGSYDCTSRIWKVQDSTQLVYRAGKHTGSVDAVALITEELFVTGGDDGYLSLWSWQKKKPVARVFAHNASGAPATEQAYTGPTAALASPPASQGAQHGRPVGPRSKLKTAKPNWITAVSACKNTDLVASGSCDGFVRLWRVSAKGLSLILELSVPGFVTSLDFNGDGTLLAVGAGREHRLGSWTRINSARDCVRIFRLPTSEAKKTT